MKNIKYILLALSLVTLLVACTSEGENRLVRYKTSDLSELKVYVGSERGVKNIDLRTFFAMDTVPADKVNTDSLRRVMATRYFGNLSSSDRGKFEGGQVSYEFADGRVTYISRSNESDVHLLVSTYEFRNDSLFIDMNNGVQHFAGLGTSEDSIFYRRSFAASRRAETGLNKIVMLKDTLLTNEVLGERYGFKEDLSDMTERDTIVWCNVRYLFGK